MARAASRKKWDEENPDKVKGYRKRWGEKYRGREVARVRKWRRKNAVTLLIVLAKYRAKKKGIPFNLKKEDIYIPTHCPVLGLKLERGVGKPQDNSPSVDRIKPELGYVVGNVCVISHRANSLKRDGSLSDFENIVRYLQRVSG